MSVREQPTPPVPRAGDGAEAASFDVPPHDFVADLVGDVVHADLRALIAGNQFMVVPELLDRFVASQDPGLRVFYETLPPGVLIEQLRQGSLRVGSLVLRFTADVLAASPDALSRLHEEGLVETPRCYASNALTLLVRSGNPGHVRGWEDLARDDVRITLPDPEIEGIGRKALDAIGSAGGEALQGRVQDRLREGDRAWHSSLHHRQAVDWLLQGSVDVAVVWQTEARHHREAGAPVQEIPLAPEQNRVGEYAVAAVRNAPHPQPAAAFVEYLASRGPSIYQGFGFAPP